MKDRYYPPHAGRSGKPLPPLPASATSEAAKKRISNLPASDIDRRGVTPSRPLGVHTDVTETASPAITKEHVQPWQHEKVEEKITREVHTHDVYHHILPIIETETLPARHFIESSDGRGLVEIQVDAIDEDTAAGPSGYGQPGQAGSTERRVSPHDEESRQVEETRSANTSAPILADKRTYTTREGIPRTEYLWRHPPVFEDATGRTEPVLIPAGLTPEWRTLLDRENKAEARGPQSRAADDARAHAGGPDPARTWTTAQGGHSRHDTPGGAASVSEPWVPANAGPDGAPETSGLAGQGSPGRGRGRGGEMMRGRGRGLAKKGSHGDLKGLAGALVPPDAGHGRDSAAAGPPDTMDGPSSQLRRETEEQARREFRVLGMMDEDRY